jgi:hypothetical protein
MNDLVVYKNRTITIPVDLGIDVSADTITSEIREGKNSDSDLIAEWDVTFQTDGTDGLLYLTLDDSVTSLITQKVGYMDFKRVSSGEPLPVLAAPIRVRFRDSVTA